MKIEIVKAANADDAMQAWCYSRDPLGKYKMSAVLSVDAPVTEMPSALLHFIDFTIAEREIFASLRSHVMWARTSRVDDPLLFTVPPELYTKVEHEHYREMMRDEAAHGVAQDTWRMHLPLAAHTSWTARMHIRDMAKLCNYFGYLREQVFVNNMALCERFQNVHLCLFKTLVHMLGKKKALLLLDNMKLAKFLNEAPLDCSLSALWHEGAFQVVHCTVPVALRAQIVRHRELQFADNFLELICREDFANLQLSDLVQMELVARKDIWRSIMSKRACWIAQADLWQQLTRLFDSGILPCADGNCPYKIDAEARMHGQDPGAPCPRYMNLYSLDKTQWLKRMRAEAAARGAFWVKEVE